MTSNETATTNRSIARRSLIGLLGSGMATLAGCFGGSAPDDSESTDEPDEGSTESTETPSVPEERSQYIESTEVVATEEGTVTPELALEVTVVDSFDWYAIDLLTESGENYSRGTFDTGETQTRVPLTDSVEETEPVPPGDHTLLLDAADLDAEVSFTLSTQMELVEAVAGSSREDLDEDSLGLVFRNTGRHADATARLINDGEEDDLDYDPIPPGETGLAEDIYGLGEGGQCEENEVRERQYTVEFLWSDPLTVSVPIELTDDGLCQRSLAGTATVVSGPEGTES